MSCYNPLLKHDEGPHLNCTLPLRIQSLQRLPSLPNPSNCTLQEEFDLLVDETTQKHGMRWLHV